MDPHFGSNSYGFFVLLLVTNDWASDGNILDAYTRGCNEAYHLKRQKKYGQHKKVKQKNVNRT